MMKHFYVDRTSKEHIIRNIEGCYNQFEFGTKYTVIGLHIGISLDS
jgi:hypothetical protein